MAKAKKPTFNQARKDILARTAAGLAAIDKLAAGADTTDIDHLPVIETRIVPPSPRVYTQAPVDARPPMAPPVCYEVDVSLYTRNTMRRAAKRAGMSTDEFSDLAVRCILDAAEADNMPGEIFSAVGAVDSGSLLGHG